MKEQKLFINDMNYINQHYTIKIFGFIPNSSFKRKQSHFVYLIMNLLDYHTYLSPKLHNSD
ncbi:hypothetical protein REIP_0186 [Rickettsia endosymbiont of Ixodes pacificus]|nr:hypothetical protein REIP_0186 [Rickettsia endosymbiont of Ixodes pacificus]